LRSQDFRRFRRKIPVGDDAVDCRRRNNTRQASTIEFRGVADGDRTPRRFHHRAVDARLEKIGGGEADFRIETVDAEEKNIRMYFLEDVFGERSNQGKGILSQAAADQNDFEIRAGEIGCDVDSVGDNRELRKAFEFVRDSSRGGSGIEHDALAFLNHPGCRRCDPLLFLRVVLLLLLERWVKKGTRLNAQGATVGSLH